MAEHLIFSTHFYAFAVFALTVLIPVIFAVMVGSLRLLHAPRAVFTFLGRESGLTAVLFVLFASYLYSGLRRMYGDSRLTGGVRSVLLFGAYQLIVLTFALSMFRVTLWAM
jgi:hypothetical protein